ncbi:MAG: choice-of-anchor J domain-containing protein [Bacteroidales bacterium]|nr:choice-of-anchor J domain-containing protein [Bacteroidales bacterium]
MKKLFTTMLLLLALVIMGKAQAPLLSEGFEEGIPDTWTIIDADNDGHKWMTNTPGTESATAHNGSYYAYSRSWINSQGALHPDNWLITPAITIPSTGNYDLTMWVCSMQDDFPQETYGVYISTSNDPEDLTSYVLLYEDTLEATHGGVPAQSQGYWQQVIVHLNGYTGNVHIAIRHYNCNDQVAICVDDITVSTASTDPAVTVNATDISFGSSTLGSNFGRKQFNVSGMNLTSDVTLTLPAGTPFGISTDTVNFSNNVTLTPTSGNINSAVYVVFNPTAANYYSSAITITSQVGTNTVNIDGLAVDCSQNQTIPWFESFTTTDFPSNCWTMTSTDTADYVGEDEDGNPVVYPGVKRYTWYNSTTSQYASVVGDQEAVQDEHLYTPTFDLSNASGAADFQFEFRTNPNIQALIDGNVRFTVRMSTDGGNTYTTVWDVADIRADFSAYWTGWSDIWPVKFNMDQYLGSNALIKFDFHYEADLGAADQVIVQAVKFTNYSDPRMTVNAEDTIDFFTYIGNPEAITIPVDARNLSEAINVNTTAPFEVSTDGNAFAATATLPATGGNLYVRYNPTSNGSDIANLVIGCNYTDTTQTNPDTTFNFNIVLTGNAYDCSVINLPIAESFETPEGDVLAPNATEYCWSAIKGNTADAQNAIINSNDYAYVGSQSFRFSSNKFNSQQMYDQYLITPELNANNAMLVMFNYANASALKDETFAVGYSTTGNAIGDFTWEADIVNEANTEWQLYRNTNVPANVKYVAVHYKSQYKAYLYIDNFQIMEAPSCMFPVELRAENTATSQADIIWTAGANETSWEMVYGVAPLDLASATPTTVNTLGTSLTGLTANTHYQVAVRAICGDGHSDWSEIADFWTTTTPATVPYTQTFEDNDADRANWVLVNGNEANYFMYGNTPGSTTGKALIITNNGSANQYLTQVGDNLTSHYSTVWAYRDLQFPETTAPAFMLTLNWKCFGEVDYDFGEMFIGNATEVTNFERNENIPGFVDVNTTHYTPAGLTNLGRFVGKSTMQNGAYLIPAEGISGQVKRLYFLWTNDSLSGAETPLAIDNINISIPQFANMTGIVSDADNGTPIVGATVSMVSNQGFTATATTDNNGSYLIENVVAGYYTITVSAHGYQTLSTGYALSEGNNNVPFELAVEECVIIPTGVQYTIEEDNMILNWDAIESGVISRAESSTYSNAIGGPSQFGCYHLFTPSDLTSANGSSITSIGAFFNGEPEYVTYKLRIYVGGSVSTGPASEEPVYEQEVRPDQITVAQWNDITLNTPHVIDGSQCLWIGYHLIDGGDADGNSNYSAGVTDQGHANDGYGNVMYSSGEWTTLLTAASTLNYNWMIRANVQAPALTYNILEDGQVIASGLEEAEYIVSPFSPNSCYQIQTVCENGQLSSPSDCAGGSSINDVNASNNFEVYPNPAHETVTVSTTMNAQKVEVLNYLGQVIYTSSVSSNNFTLNVANYADGVYFIRLTSNEGIATQKLIKK